MILVQYNNIIHKEFKNFDDIFDENQLNIKYLDCSNNQLTELPIEICHLINLRWFNCSYNQLTNIPIEIINCRNLRYIYYIGNEIIMNPIIQRFIDRIRNINNHNLYIDNQNVHSSSIQESVKKSIINLLKDV